MKDESDNMHAGSHAAPSTTAIHVGISNNIPSPQIPIA
jgi:hypothetical protein